MERLTIKATHKYFITQMEDGEVIVVNDGDELEVTDAGLIMDLALTIRNLQNELEIEKNLNFTY